MATVFSTRMTSRGQTTIPKEVRDALRIKTNSRVYWTLGDGEAWVSVEEPVPCTVHNEEEFWERIGVALKQVGAGNVREAGAISRELREKYGLA